METYMSIKDYVPAILVMLLGFYYIIVNPVGKDVTKQNKKLLTASSGVSAPTYANKTKSGVSLSKSQTNNTSATRNKQSAHNFGTLQIGEDLKDSKD